MRTIEIIIAGVWIAFWAYWLVASANTKASRTGSRSLVGIRAVVILVAVVLIRTGVFKGHATTIHNHWLEGTGLAVFLLGLAFAVWARIYLGRNWGRPMSQRVDPDLVTTGPYRYVRHPIYTGIIVGSIGTTMAVSVYWLIAVVLIGAYFFYSATVEERNMERVFPDTYPAYKRSTKMLIPFIL